MKLLKYLIILCCCLFFFNAQVYSQVFSFESGVDEGTATLPRGTMIKAVLQETVSSKDNAVGNRVHFVINSDLTVGQATCIPEGSYLYGKIIQLEHAKPGRDGFFQILIDKIVFPDGWQTSMTGNLWTRDGTGIIGGGFTKRQEFKKVPHYIEDIGPVVQLVKTGPRVMGQERALPAGSEVIVVIEQDLKVKYLESLE